MYKKQYVKPELKIVALRSEERMAVCDYYYKTGQTGSGCHDVFFDVINPSTCIVMTTPQSVS